MGAAADGTRRKLRSSMGNRKVKTQADVIAEILRADRRKMVAGMRARGMTWEAIRIAVQDTLKIAVSQRTIREDFDKYSKELAETSQADFRAMYDSALRATLDGHLDRARAGNDKSARVVERSVRTHAWVFGASLDTALLAGAGAKIDLTVDIHEALLEKLERAAVAASKSDGPDSTGPAGAAAAGAGEGHPQPDGG